MKDRIRQIMDDQRMTQKEFAQFTGISEGSLSGVFNERTRPTIQMIETIHEKLPNISVEWIMFGTGSMYITENSQTPSNDAQTSEKNSPLLDVQNSSLTPSLFDDSKSTRVAGGEGVLSNVGKTVVKYIDKPERKITEIRIFYDDQTWETFVPKR